MAKAKESYEEWKNRKEQEGFLPAPDKQRTTSYSGSDTRPKESYEEWKARKEGKTTSNSFVTSFLDDSRAFLSSAQKEHNALNYQNGKTAYVNRMTAAERLKARGRQVRQYIERNGDSSEYSDLKKYLADFEKSANDVLDAFRSSADFYSQFESEDKYNEYVAYQKDRDEKSKFDIDAGQEEIASLEKELNALKQKRNLANSYQVAENAYLGSPYAAAQQGNISSESDGRISELEKLISQKKQYLNQAKRIQDGITLSSVSGNADFKDNSGYVSTQSDNRWAKLTSDYGLGYEDLTYEYINNQDGIRDEIKQKHRTYSKNDDESLYEEKGYDYLTENEVAIFNYYYAKEGKDKAQEYLDSIQESLNLRKATGMYENMEEKTLLELAFGVAAGLDQFESGTKNLFNTEDDYIPQTAKQMASGLVREDLADAGPKLPSWMGGASLGQVGYDAITTTANMAPSILASTVIGTLFPGTIAIGAQKTTAGAIAGSALMGGSAAGNAYQEALNEGYDKNQARGYGLLVGASETVMENVLGGISAVGGNALGKYMTQNVGAADTALKMIGKRLGASGLSEFTEEYLQEVLTPVFQNIMLDTNNEVKLFSAEALYSGILGALTAGIMEGPTAISGEVRTNRIGKQLKAAGVSAQRLADIGKTFAADTVAYQLAGKVDENTNAYTMGRLFNEIGATLTEQNVNDITEALVAKGWDRDVAAKNAKVMAAVVDGEKLSDKEVAIIEANDSLAEAMRTTIVDPNATWFQRNKGYNDIAMTLAQKMTATKSAKTKQSLPGQENAVASEQADTVKEIGAEETPAPSRVQSITRIQGENVTVKLEDGSEVSIKDADLDPNDGVLIETIARIDGISAEDANYIFNALKAAPGARADFAAIGAAEAYRYGRYGFTEEYMTKRGVFANSLTESQRQAIYEIGQRARQQQVASKQSEIEKSVHEAQATLEKESSEGTENSNRSYRATLEDGISVLSLDESQKASYKLADQIAEAAKVNIRVYVGKTGEHGYYNPNTDEIYLNLNATNKSRKSMMAFTLGHELVHRAKKGSPAKYEAFAKFLIEQYGKQGSNVEAMIAEQINAAKEFGIKMTYDKALEEVVCDACQRMLLDTDAGQKLAEFGAQSKQNKSFLEDLKRWIKDFMDNLRSIFTGVDPDSLAAREFAKFDENVKQILADMYVDMTIDAGENLSTIQNAFGKDTMVETNEHGEFTMASNKDGSEKLFNLVTWKNGGRETLEATLLREGYTEEEVKAALTIMDGKQSLVESIANEVDGNGKMAFPEQGRINEATLTTDLKDGHSVLSALVSNGDYPVNIDLLMVCKKRKAYQRVINRLCETGMIQQATVDALAIAEINKILGKYGFETACLGCFVESRRLRIQEWAQTIVKEWNAEVKKRNPNAKAFSFGKGEATLTPDEVMKIIGELESGGAKNDKGNLNLGQGSAVKRMGVLLDKVPSLRRTLSVEDLITPDGLSSLRSFDSNLFSMVKSRYGSNSPKFVQEFNPYNHELAMYGKVPSEYKSLREYLYAIGGARMQSFSDFIVENWFDYCQIVADLAARKLPMHTYTKEIALAKLFGLTGIKINMSLIPDIDRSLGKDFAGLTRNEKGELELIWADKDRFKKTGGKSYMQSINFADAVALQNDPRYSANIGTIAVGVSDKHIEIMLDDARIRMIIPYHSSGMNPIFADLMGTSYYKDYTNFQNTTVKQLYNSKGQKVTLKLDKTQVGKLTSGFQFNEVLQDLGDARAAAEAYKEWCADASKHTITIKGETYTAELTPKFNDFSGHQNYYKLLEDFNTYDCISEQAARQGDVQQIYPEDFDDILKAELKAQEGHRQKQETNQSFDKAMGEIESYLKNHSKADTVYYAQQHGIKLSKKDSKLDAADKAKLKKLQEEGVSFKLPVMGDKKSPTTLTEQDLRDLLQKAKDKGMHDGTYFPVRINTPDALIYAITVMAKKNGITSESELAKLTKDRPIAIQVYKARQSLATEDDWDETGTPHNLSIDDFVGMVKKMDDPEYIVYEGSTGRYVEILKYKTARGKDTFAVVELENFKGEQHLNGYGQDTYNILVTMYQPDAKKRVVNLLNGKDNVVIHPKKEKDNLQLTSGIHVPSVLNKSPFAPSLPHIEDVVNAENNDIRYKLPVGEDTSPRALLSNAFETIVTNPIEKQKLQEYKDKISLINAEEQKLRELREQIKELSFAKGPKDTKKIRSLQFEAQQAANRINTYDKILLRMEAYAPLQNVLNREKEMARKRAEQKGKEALTEYKKKAMAEQQEIAERYRESRKKAISKAKESRDKREAREKLQKLVLDTAKWISHPAKTDVKCPDLLKQPYTDFLSSIDMSSERLAKGGDPTKNDLRLANAMGSLATALEKVMASQDPTQDTAAVLDAGYLDLPANFVQKLRDMTEDVKAMMIEGEYVVNAMTAEEIRKLSQMIRTLNHAIKEVSTLYANLRFANVEMLGDESMSFMDAIGEIQNTSGMKDFVQWENALPYYAFKRFGKGGESIFEGLMDAQDKLAFLAQKIFNFQENTWKGDEAKKWSEDTHTIDLPDGEQLTLTTADAMSIYCLSRRQQGLQHLLGGGVRVMGIQKGSQKAKDSRSTLTIKDIDAIISSLTDRQKKVAEAIQEFMSTTCSEWGNEISMKRFLTKEFNEKFYFPIESNDENLPTKDPSAQQSDLFRLLNISATKAIDPRANNEVIIRNIFDVFTGHASDMARLNAFGLPLLDYMKWLNYREKTVNEEGQIKVRGVRKYMETAYGNAAKSYVLNLIKDVNGRPSDNGDPSILMKWMRSAKTASVGSSFRVATLQLTSYPRAALVLSPKSLVLGLSKIPNIEKAKKYCGIALWKSFGFYDTNISRSIEEQMKGVKDVKQKLIEFSLKGAEWGDAITWGAMWNACEYEVASTKKYKVGSEEFYEAVGKKLREVVYRTQVVDSTLTRSQIMRSKRGMTQEAAAFMSEPTLSANILMDAGMEFNLEKRRTNAKTAWNKTGKYVTNALAVYSIGQLTAALLEGLWDAWRDDEDEKFGDKFVSAFTENLVMDLVPFNKIPIVSDVFEAGLAMIGVGFYSSDKMSTTWLTQAVSAADAWRDVIGGNSSVTTYNALYKSVRALSSFYGVSASGVMREGVDLWNNTAGAYDLTLKVLSYARSKAELGSLLLDAIIEGNDRQADSLRAEFEDEDAYQSALRSAIKERYLAGEIDTSTAQEYLALYGGKDGSKAYWLTEEWMYESDSDEEFGKYNKFFDAVKTGKNLKTVIKEYTSNGVKPETLAGQITEHFKPEYVEMTKSEKASIKGYLLNAFEQCGVKREDAAKKLQYWEFLSDNPGSDLNQSQAENYQEFAKPAGISVKQFADYCRKTKGISKKEDLMNVIDSLPINSAQKDALYYAEGWAKSKLNEAPWH